MDDPHERTESSIVDVEALVALALERIAGGESGVIETLCTAHPEQAAEIRASLDALRDMNLLPSDASAMAFPERLGDFRLLRRLGGGGMGVVYEAIQEPLGRRVALKLIRPEHLYFERSRERFRRETDAVARLSHPGVVAIYTVGEAAGTPYFAMEMIRGASLAQVLEQVRGLAPESLLGSDLRAAVLAFANNEDNSTQESGDSLFAGTWVDACTRVILRMTEALDHAHARGVLHRDIKPSNIAVTPEGRVVLLDFGLAGIDDEVRMTRSGSALGSVLYMAPEQVAGRTNEIDARTDVYALGVTLYELLTLQTPFAASDSEQTRAAILEGQALPIRARHRGVPRDLEIVCLHAIERDRSRRYASMQAFGADLRNVLEGRPIHVRPPSALYRARRWMTRHPTRSATLALSALLITILPSALYFQQRSNNRALRELLDEVTLARERATEESTRARVAAAEADDSANFLVELFGASDPYDSGRRNLTARELLEIGLERVEHELGGQLELQARLFERIGLSYNNLDLYAQALVPLERALQLRRDLHGDDDPRTAGAMLMVASALRLANRPGAVNLLRKANAIYVEHPPSNVGEIINVEALLAMCLIDEGGAEEPLALLSRADQRLNEQAEQPPALRWLVSSFLATTHLRLGHLAEAEAIARAALLRDPEVVAPLKPWRCASLNTLASALRRQGRSTEALEVYLRLMDEARAIYEVDNPTLALMEADFGEFLFDRGDADEAFELLERANEVLQRQLGLENEKARRGLSQLVDTLMRARRPQRALEALQVALESLSADEQSNVRSAPLRFRAGLAHLALGERELAITALRRCDAEHVDTSANGRATLELTLARALVSSPDSRAEARQIAETWSSSPALEFAAMARTIAARAAWLDDELEAAARFARASLDVHSELHMSSWAGSQARIVLADIGLRSAFDAERCRELNEALDALEAELGPDHCDVAELHGELAISGAADACAETRRTPPSPAKR